MRQRVQRGLPWLASAVAAGLIVFLVWPLLQGRAAGGAAYAAGVERLQRAGTLAFSVRVETGAGPAGELRFVCRADGLARLELADGSTLIADSITQRFYQFNHVRREVVVRPDRENLARWYGDLRTLPTHAVSELGESEIDGAPALGFLVVKDGANLTVWVDRRTQLPLRVEIPHAGDGGHRTVIDKIVFEPPLAPDVFDVSTPPGYRQVEPTDGRQNSRADAADESDAGSGGVGVPPPNESERRP